MGNPIGPRVVEVIGAPSDLGANIRGANLGPQAIRIAGLHHQLSRMGIQVVDADDILVPTRECISDQASHRYRDVIAALCSKLAAQVEQAMTNGHLPITIGGDHSLAIGSISGVSEFLLKKDQRLGVIWFDAHADINSPQSSPSGNIHGMPVATLLGDGFPQLTSIGSQRSKVLAKNVVLVGIRDLDEPEKSLCRQLGVHTFTTRDIDEQGMRQVVGKALELAADGTGGVHVSFDLDAVDPSHAPGVSTPVEGGLSLREAHLALELIAENTEILSLDMMELNPTHDENQRTARLAVELVCSALGKVIL